MTPTHVRHIVAVLLGAATCTPLFARASTPSVTVEHNAARREIIVTVGPILLLLLTVGYIVIRNDPRSQRQGAQPESS